MLNPQYKLDIMPATTQSYTLILPSNRVTDYIINCDSIYAKDSVYLKEYLNPSTVAKKMPRHLLYIIRLSVAIRWVLLPVNIA